METRVGQQWRRADYEEEEPQIQRNIQRSATIYKLYNSYLKFTSSYVNTLSS